MVLFNPLTPMEEGAPVVESLPTIARHVSELLNEITRIGQEVEAALSATPEYGADPRHESLGQATQLLEDSRAPLRSVIEALAKAEGFRVFIEAGSVPE